MVFRNRRSMRLRPINTLKHTIDIQSTIPAGTELDSVLVKGVDAAVSSVAIDCDIGAHVTSIFLNVQVVNSTNAVGTVNNAYMYVFGNPGENIPLTSFPSVNQVGTSDNRKLIFHQEMAMLSDANDSIPITLFRGVLKIPRKFGRLGVNDTILIRIGTPVGGAEIDACVQCIYKEIR